MTWARVSSESKRLDKTLKMNHLINPFRCSILNLFFSRHQLPLVNTESAFFRTPYFNTVKKNVVPTPSSDLSHTSPPCCATIRLTSAKPMPVPE